MEDIDKRKKRKLPPIRRLPVGKEFTPFSFPPQMEPGFSSKFQHRKISLINRRQLNNLNRNITEQFFPSTLHVRQ